jgi:hypothetical protein
MLASSPCTGELAPIDRAVSAFPNSLRVMRLGPQLAPLWGRRHVVHLL